MFGSAKQIEQIKVIDIVACDYVWINLSDEVSPLLSRKNRFEYTVIHLGTSFKIFSQSLENYIHD
jgi:hypothetical protein